VSKTVHLEPGRLSGDAYRAVRSHELMLNQATSAFEHAVLVPLTALNGGALAAFLTLVGAIVDQDARVSAATGWVVAATGAWSAGLLAAALATSFAFRKQRAISAAHRALRQEVEELLFPGQRELVEVLKGPEVSREEQRSLAERYAARFEYAWWGSVVCFVGGAICATKAIV
jgi:hypothetical protein